MTGYLLCAQLPRRPARRWQKIAPLAHLQIGWQAGDREHWTCSRRRIIQISPWVERFLCGITAGGTILDVACGSGRHLRTGLAAGYRMTGIDIDLGAVADLADEPGVELLQADLESGAPLPVNGRQFDGVIVTNYLWRPILSDIIAAVAPSGLLIYETFATGNERYGKPSNPDFLLKPGELIAAVSPHLTTIAFETASLTKPLPKVVQRIAAVGPGHPWMTAPPTQD